MATTAASSATTHSFTVRTHCHSIYGGHRRSVQVLAYETAAALHAAHPEHADAIAFCQPTQGEMNAAGWEVKPRVAATVVFALDTTTPEIVAHECVHAALAIYRMDVAASARMGRGVGPREEAVAYLVGELVGGVTAGLKRVRKARR